MQKDYEDIRDVIFYDTVPNFEISYRGVVYKFYLTPDLPGEYWDFDEVPRGKANEDDLDEIRRVCLLLDQEANQNIDRKVFVEKWLGVYVRNDESGK